MNILFITLTNIGDIVQSSAVLNRVLDAHPDARVDVVVGKGGACLFENLPQLNRLIPITKRKMHLHWWDIYKSIVSTQYDVVIDLRGSLLSRIVNARHVVRFNKSNNDLSHRVERFASMVKGHGSPKISIWPNKVVDEEVLRQITTTRPYIAIAPTANWKGKQWPQKKYSQLINKLVSTTNFKDVNFVVFGAEKERYSVADLLASLPKDRCVDLVGKTSLPEASIWLENAFMFIGNDSGLAHISASVGTPTVTLFGPTKEVHYAPYHEFSKVVTPNRRTFSEVNLEPEALPRLMTDISVDQVFATVCEVASKLK